MANGGPGDPSLTDKWPALVSGAIGLVLTNTVTLAVSICDCLTTAQTTAALALVNSCVAAAVMIWQYHNMWSRASVARVLDNSNPNMTTKQATAIAQGDVKV